MPRAKKPADPPAPRGYGRGSVTVRPDGRIMARVLITGERFERIYPRRLGEERARREAHRWLDRLLKDAATGAIPDDGRTTLKEYLDGWLVPGRPDWRPATRLSHYTLLGYFVADLAEVPEVAARKHRAPRERAYCADLGGVRLRDLEDGRRLADAFGGLAASGLAPGTLILVHRSLRGALADATRRRPPLLGSNPMAAIPPPKVRRKQRRRVYAADEIARLIEALRGDPLAGLVLLAIESGLRNSELRGLRWRDLRGRRLTVTWLLSEDGSAYRELKTEAGYRELFVTPELAALLEAARGADEAPMFTWPDAGRERTYSAQLLRKRWGEILRRAALPHVRLHDLRHACATHLRRGGTSIEVVQAVLGHADIRTTLQTYREVTDEDLERASAAMRQVLWSGRSAPEKALPPAPLQSDFAVNGPGSRSE